MKTGFKTQVLLTSLILFIVFSSFGFGVEKGGILSGTVMDESGAKLPGIQISVAGDALMGKKIVFTNENGNFRIANMPVGTNFTIEFTLEGFKKVIKKDVRISLGKTTAVSAIMKLGVITESIVVRGETPVMDPKSSTSQTNVTKEVIETLANDRQYQSIMEMMPGAIPGNNPSMMGASDSDNMYQMDGADSTDPSTKTWSGAANFDNFEEMQVITNGVPAEYGRGTGAVINVVTKSGSNQIHGTARLGMSKVDWNAKASDQNISFSDSTHYLNETRPAINLGGPIIKDKIWFFGSYERRNKWKPATWYTSWEDAAGGEPSGEGKGYYQGHYASAKVTMNFGRLSMVGHWMESPITMPEYYKYTNSSSKAQDNDLTKEQGGYNINFEGTYDLGGNSYVVGRAALTRNVMKLNSHVKTGPRYYYRVGYYSGSGYYDYNEDRNHNQYSLTFNTYQETGFGYHDIKFGVEILDIEIGKAINYQYPGGEYIALNYDGVQTRYKRIYETDVPKQAMVYNNNVTLYLQDKWEIARGLTATLGLRVEKGTWKNHGKEMILDLGFGDNLAPRLGVAYSFGQNKVTANFSRIFDLYGNHIVNENQTADFTRTYDEYRGESYGYDDWHFRNTYYYTPPPGATTIDPDLKPSHMDEMGIGFERILGDKFSIGVSYLNRKWKNVVEDYDPDGDGVYHFQNAVYNDTLQNVDWGNTQRKYNAFIVTFKKNLGDDIFQFLASYTYSTLKGFSSVDADGGWGENPYEALNAYGYLGNDVRHMVKFNGSVILPLDINLGVGLAWFSGQPYTDTVGVLYEDGGATEYDGENMTFLVDPRGTTGRYQASWHIDIRLEKKFRIKKLFTASIYMDIFNLLNQQNPITRTSAMGDGEWNGAIGGSFTVTDPSSTFGRYTAYYAPMSLAFGAKIEW